MPNTSRKPGPDHVETFAFPYFSLSFSGVDGIAGSLLVAPSGIIDNANLASFEHRVFQRLEWPYRFLVMDMSQLSWPNGALAGLIPKVLKHTRLAGTQFVVILPDGAVRQYLSDIGFLFFLPHLFDSLHDAIDWMRTFH